MSRVLVIGPSWVGDMVMAQSLFKVIRGRHPGSSISVLAPEWSHPILERMPEVSDSIVMPVGHGALQLKTRRNVARKLRERNFDQAIVLPGSLKSALIPWFARIPKRTGFVGEQRWGLLNDIRRLDRKALPLNVQRYAHLGVGRQEMLPDPVPQPDLVVDEQSMAATMQSLGLNGEGPVIAFCPGAEFGPAKRWPARHFAEIARAKHSEGCRIWMFGSEKDCEITREINGHCDGICQDLAGRTTLGQAIDLLSLAQVVVTNDSGLMHVAAATGSHVIALYGSSSSEFTPPLTADCDLLSLGLDCSPCFKRECPLGHLNCLNQLEPERVLSVMAGTPDT